MFIDVDTEFIADKANRYASAGLILDKEMKKYRPFSDEFISMMIKVSYINGYLKAFNDILNSSLELSDI